MSGAFHVEQRRRVIGVLENERGRGVDGHRSRPRGRVRRLAGVQCERVETWVTDGHVSRGELGEAGMMPVWRLASRGEVGQAAHAVTLLRQ